MRKLIDLDETTLYMPDGADYRQVAVEDHVIHLHDEKDRIL